MELINIFEVGLIILLIYIPIYCLTNRICECFERCSSNKYGRKIDEKQEKPEGF